MFKFVDLDGGDLGRGYRITEEELPNLAVRIANVMLEVQKAMNKYEICSIGHTKISYAFEFSPNNKTKLSQVIISTEPLLPLGIKFYSIENQKLFELRGASGGIVNSLICYLIAE